MPDQLNTTDSSEGGKSPNLILNAFRLAMLRIFHKNPRETLKNSIPAETLHVGPWGGFFVEMMETGDMTPGKDESNQPPTEE